jgi:hypothetical protein
MKLHNTGIFKKEVNKNIDLLFKNQINSIAIFVQNDTQKYFMFKNELAF